MQTLDRKVLEHLKMWIEQQHSPWLFTIVRTLGSSPRPIGSLFAITNSGLQIGSVSGGCIEEDLLEKVRAGQFTGTASELIEYGISSEENERLGLPCGGKITLLLQRLTNADTHWVNTILQALSQRQCIQRKLTLNNGVTQLIGTDQFHPLSLGDQTLKQSFGPQMLMLLVGAGQLASSLAELGLAMDYEVIVTDPREQALQQWEGPDIQLIQGMPDDVVRQYANDKHVAIITLTHDPRIDDMALMEALTTNAWYVGALGSQRTTDKRLARLRQLELNDKQIARLHAPVGLDIGSKTPIEIAVSIMAQLTQLRRKLP